MAKSNTKVSTDELITIGRAAYFNEEGFATTQKNLYRLLFYRSAVAKDLLRYPTDEVVFEQLMENYNHVNNQILQLLAITPKENNDGN